MLGLTYVALRHLFIICQFLLKLPLQLFLNLKKVQALEKNNENSNECIFLLHKDREYIFNFQKIIKNKNTQNLTKQNKQKKPKPHHPQTPLKTKQTKKPQID